MSLIQEALKRQQEESTKTPAVTKPPIPGLAMKAKPPGAAETPPDTDRPASPAIPPTVPPPLPAQTQPPALPKNTPLETPPPEEEVPPAERKALSMLAIIIIVIVVLLMAGISMVYFALMKMKREAPAKAMAVLKPAITQMVAVATQVVHTTSSSNAPAAALPAGQHDATQKVATVTATNVPAVSNTTPAIAQPPPVKPPVEWPPLKLTAILGKGMKGAARINGQVVLVGETVEGVTLVQVNEQNVLLEFEGEKVSLRIGASTR